MIRLFARMDTPVRNGRLRRGRWGWSGNQAGDLCSGLKSRGQADGEKIAQNCLFMMPPRPTGRPGGE
ncbi:MAG: hypothetical protein KKC18_02420, partial [Chloroflexi bacterium]|nr:hypothetical protein [Chloroflexota bacterium]